MTDNNPAINKAPNSKQGNLDNKVVRNRNRHQEIQQPRESKFEARKKELLDETQTYMYQQSSKFSSVSRNLAIGIIGTIWILTYTDGKLHIPNCCLLVSLIAALLLLMTDVIHYFWDSRSYQREIYKFDGYNSTKDLLMKHETTMDAINQRSGRFIVAKFVILIISTILFAIGLLLKVYLK